MKIKIILMLFLSLTLVYFGACTSATTQPSTNVAPQITTAEVKSIASTNETLKMGIITNFTDGPGVEIIRTIELMADLDNKAGGLAVDGKHYNIQILSYDSKSSQSTEVAAVNRMVFEDKVKYIIADGGNISAWLPITEANKVLVNSLIPVPPLTLLPTLHYSINSCASNSSGTVATGWFVKNYPELAKNYTMAMPDNQGGRNVGNMLIGSWKAFGVEPSVIFYPPSQQDLSALGTKIKTLNPGSFGAAGGGFSDGLVLNAIRAAGYQGQFYLGTGATALSLMQILNSASYEGLINIAGPSEFDPALTPAAQKLKDAWIAKYGKWEGSDITGAAFYTCFREAIKKAGSIDTDKVTSVIYNGFEWDSPTGSSKMISRHDIGNDRTVDSITTVYMKTIKGGKPVMLATINIDEGMTFIHKMLQAAPAMPPGPPPGAP
jgi:branched-chain amino acid transport system substrate-binding protein